MKINSFEDLLVWQKSRELVSVIYKLTGKFPTSEKFNLVDQAKRCSTSIPANIAEGFSRFHLKESVMFYRNARGSLSELKSHLLIASDQGYIVKADLDFCINMIDEIGKMLNGLIKSTANFRDKQTSNT